MEFSGEEMLLTEEEAAARKEIEKLNQISLLEKITQLYSANEWKLGIPCIGYLLEQYGQTLEEKDIVRVLYMWGNCYYHFCKESIPPFSVDYIWLMLRAYDIFYGIANELVFKCPDLKIKAYSKTKTEGIIEEFLQEFKSKFMVTSADLQSLYLEEMEAIVRYIRLLMSDVPDLPEDVLQHLTFAGLTLSVIVAHSDVEYASYYDTAFELLTDGKNKSKDVNFQYFMATEAIQTLGVIVRKEFQDDKLGDSEFNSLKMVNKLMEAAGMVPVTAFQLDEVSHKLCELYPKMGFEEGTANADNIMEEFKKIPVEPDSPKYLSTKVGVYTYVMSQYVLYGNEIATREKRGQRLIFVQCLMKTRELFNEVVHDMFKLQKIGDPNDKSIHITSKVELRLNTQQMIETTQKLYETLQDTLHLIPLTISLLNAPREKARKVDPRAAKLRQEHSEAVAMAFRDGKKIYQLQQKTKYDPEEVDYIMKYVPMVSDVEIIARDLSRKFRNSGGKMPQEVPPELAFLERKKLE